jgi:hypothetical protein
MGSQNVTDFSGAKKKRIRKLLESYSPRSLKAEKQAADIGAAAAGILGAGKGNEFLQALSSRSVEAAANLMMSLAKDLKTARDLGGVYKKYGVGSDVREPSTIVSAFLTKELSDRLTRNQEDTESAFAAKDAISKTIVDVMSRAFPSETEPAEVGREKFAEAFRKVSRDEIATAFMHNVTSALINSVLDATRGSLSPAHMAELKQRIRERIVPDLIERLARGK